MLRLDVRAERFALKEPFRISNHTWFAIDAVTVRLDGEGVWGWGEGSPVVYHGETADSIIAAIDAVRREIERGVSRTRLLDLMPPGSARCAVDCALWHWQARRKGVPVYELAGLQAPQPVGSAITVSLDEVDEMAAYAERHRDYPLLKVKLGGASDHGAIRAVRAAAPRPRITVDANTGWDIAFLKDIEPLLAELGVELIEQPLPPEADDALRHWSGRIPLAADESCQTSADVPALKGKYQVASIKLDKTGGLTEALRLKAAAEEAGLGLMVSCMVATSLSMAPAQLLAPYCRVVDLDGPMNAAEDREPPIEYRSGVMMPAPPALWG
jgi:L-Ala-D/L-Glu epimerase